VLFRLAYLNVTNAFAALRLPPMSDRDKDVEILALRHQITVLERQLGADTKVRFTLEGRAFLASLLASLPREVLRRLRLLVRPDTVLRRHRDLMKRRHARTCRPKRRGRPPMVRSIRALILRLVRENPGWGYRRVHGELTTLGIKVAPSTVWEILKQAGLVPAPERASTTWADFPALASRRPAGLRFHRDRHFERAAPVHPGGHRACHQARPRAGHHRSSERELGHPGDKELGDGSG
jgi:transposase